MPRSDLVSGQTAAAAAFAGSRGRAPPRIDAAQLRSLLANTGATHYRIAQLSSVSPRFVKDVASGRARTLSRPYRDALLAAIRQAEQELANRVEITTEPT